MKKTERKNVRPRENKSIREGEWQGEMERELSRTWRFLKQACGFLCYLLYVV